MSQSLQNFVRSTNTTLSLSLQTNGILQEGGHKVMRFGIINGKADVPLAIQSSSSDQELFGREGGPTRVTKQRNVYTENLKRLPLIKRNRPHNLPRTRVQF
jgi:hypothetical protein